MNDSADREAKRMLRALQVEPLVLEDAAFWVAAGVLAYHHQETQASTACYRRALKLDRKAHSARVNLAVNLAMEGKHVEALQTIAEVPGRSHRKEVIKANILQDIGRHEEAIKNYELAIEDEPDFFLPYARILNSLRALNSPLMEYWLQRGMQAVPTSANIGSAFCHFLLREGRIDNLAAADWIAQLRAEVGRSDMIGLNADDPALITECELLRRIAQIELTNDKELLRKTVEEYAGRLGVGRDPCDIGRGIVLLSSRLGFVQGVEIGYEHVCERCRSDRKRLVGPKALFLAVAQAHCGNHQAAAELCESVLSEEPNNPVALWEYWWSLDEVGRTVEAIAIAEQLAEQDPQADSIYYNLGYLCGKDGQLGKAGYFYAKQIELLPNHREAIENLGFIELLRGDIDCADRLMHRFTSLCQSEWDNRKSNLLEEGEAGVPEELFPEILDHVLTVAYEQLDAKKAAYANLRSLAVGSLGNQAYVADLIRANNASRPVFGAHTSIKPRLPSMQDIVSAMGKGHGADFEDVQFQLKLRAKGDLSPVFKSIETALPKWQSLPDNAVQTLIECETRLLDHQGNRSCP